MRPKKSIHAEDDLSGDWFEGKRHGKGIKTSFNGNTYDGDWENNKKTGKSAK
jgi:hypothetical protein